MKEWENISEPPEEGTGTSSEKKKKRPASPIPHHSLEEALKVAKAILEGNNGKPWDTVRIAQALDMSKASSKFRDLTSSAYKYGIVTGTWNANSIGITDLGQGILKPKSQEQEIKSKQKSVCSIEAFKKIYEHYRDGRLPTTDTYFRNVLESDFSIPMEYIDECLALLVTNGNFANILFDNKGSLYVTFETEAPIESPTTPPIEPPPSPEVEPPEPIPIPSVEIKPTSVPPEPPLKNKIFVVHGKNQEPMKQLKGFLEKFHIPFVVAVDEPHKGRPISKKVAELMRECTSAIIIFTPDEEYVDPEGKKIWRPSDNAVYELGAASILYDKIVILKEKSVTLASDFSDIGYIVFEKDQVAAQTAQLLSEFVGLGLVKITPT